MKPKYGDVFEWYRSWATRGNERVRVMYIGPAWEDGDRWQALLLNEPGGTGWEPGKLDEFWVSDIAEGKWRPA